MRLPCRETALIVAVCAAFLAACGSGAEAGSCTRDRDCATGEGCVAGACVALPCGGCQPEEACNTSTQQCETAQGATCSDHSCPADYPCNGNVCSKSCTLDNDCDQGFRCNPATKSCAQCVSDGQCDTVPGKPVCDSTTGNCAQCNVNFDCYKQLGSGHYCEAHTCKPGCKVDGDCDGTKGETCDTSTTPGKCIECKTTQDCSTRGAGGACDDTGHCVECFGSSQSDANVFCSQTKPECDLGSKTCVQCLPANNASGADCGFPGQTGRNSHDTQTCNGNTHSCVDGCAFDTQCGCKPIKDTNGFVVGLDCGSATGVTATAGTGTVTWHQGDLKKCDPVRTTSAQNPSAPSLGACVQCLGNRDCDYTVNGKGGSLNGARCDKRSGTSYEYCVEGCDADADCPANKICHLGGPGDANNNKCVDCACDNPSADGTYCETNLAGQLSCAIFGTDAAGNSARVCDKATLLCRKRRQNEQCLDSAQCGDTQDPTLGGCFPAAKCVISSLPTTGSAQKCDGSLAFGRCGTPCDDLQQNQCIDGTSTSCPGGSSCRQATYASGTTPNTTGTACVSQLCNVP